MSSIVYNHAQIEGFSADLNAAKNQLVSLLDDGKATMGQLANAWGGVSSDAYQQANRKYNELADSINAKLGSTSMRISDASANMASTDQAGAGLFG